MRFRIGTRDSYRRDHGGGGNRIVPIFHDSRRFVGGGTPLSQAESFLKRNQFSQDFLHPTNLNFAPANEGPFWRSHQTGFLSSFPFPAFLEGNQSWVLFAYKQASSILTHHQPLQSPCHVTLWEQFLLLFRGHFSSGYVLIIRGGLKSPSSVSSSSEFRATPRASPVSSSFWNEFGIEST